jgi:trans-2,3-dihydro-3-hydroxyanthranilate isomerase
MHNKFYIVDVFAEKKYSGNQLAVIRNASNLSSEEMQKIAFEFNFPETTFILSDDINNNGFDVRIFTPKEEIPFAGHPTLGTAYVIQNEILSSPDDKVTLNLKVGQIPVTTEKNLGIFQMQQNQPSFGQLFEADIVCEVLSITKQGLDTKFPIEEVSTGLPCIIVPVKNLLTLKNIKINREKYFDLVGNISAKLILAFCSETYSDDLDLSVRVFVDYYGIPEDPATGSGNGCLAGYIVKHRYFDKTRIEIRTGQGYEINRPSKIYLKAAENDTGIDVFVGGKVIKIAEGSLII